MDLRYKTLSSHVAPSAAVGAAHLRNGGSIDAGSALERESGSHLHDDEATWFEILKGDPLAVVQKSYGTAPTRWL
jgi:hypothetical protein